MTDTNAIDFAKLAEPFPPQLVSWRVGSTNGDKTKGLALAYIDARDVQDRLDEVCGPGNWQVRHPWAEGKKLACEIGIRINGEWVWKGDGAGDSDVEAEKGAFSDSFKRAAVRWGVARYLYDVKSPWVKIEQFGRSYKIAETEYDKLRNVLPRPAAARPGAKQDQQKPQAANDGEKAAAETIKLGIDQCQNPDELTAFWREHVKHINSLPEALKQDLINHAGDRKRALTPSVAAE